MKLKAEPWPLESSVGVAHIHLWALLVTSGHGARPTAAQLLEQEVLVQLSQEFISSPDCKV